MIKEKNKFKLFAVSAIAAVVIVASQNVLAHTRLKTSTIDENNANHGSDYNDVVIAHGCKNETDGSATIDTIGSVTVFPDGKDSIITTKPAGSDSTVAATPYEGGLTDFVTNWVSPVTLIQNNSVFTERGYIKDSLGNKLGFWVGGGNGLTAGFRGLIPFTTTGVVINPESCAKSVTFVVSIADICEITDKSGFRDSTVLLWTPAVGSDFDGVGLDGYDSPATLKVNRTVTALPASCGEGLDVTVKPSAAQLNRDMKVVVDGVQVWPK